MENSGAKIKKRLINYLSPIQLVVIIASFIFVIELFLMVLFHSILSHVSVTTEVFLDATLLVVLLSPLFYFFLFRPITFHINESRSIDKERARLSAIIEITTDFVGTADTEGRVLSLNRAGRKMIGIGEDEDISNTRIPDHHPDWAGKIILEEGIPAAIREGVWRGETALLSRDGREIYVSQVIMSHKAQNGAVEFLSTIMRDISEHKKAEDALRKSESSLENAQRIARMGNWEWDIEKNELYWSDEIYRIFGLIPHDFGATYEAFLNSVHPDDRELVKKSVSEAVNENMPYKIDHRILLPDGSVRIVHEQAEVLFDDADRAIKMNGTVQDITERRELENQFRHAQKMEAIGALTGGIAHDFNNILTAMMGYCSLLKMKMGKDEPLVHNIDQILSLTEKAANLTGCLLAFGRKQVSRPKRLNLNETINRTAKILMRLIGEDIELKTMLTDKELPVMADSGQIEQVLMNLCANARDAMPDGGSLTIQTEIMELDSEYTREHGYGSPGIYILLSVTDTGMGMDEKTKEKIFEPFFTTKGLGEGTGLGLSIVYGIIKQHNGYINVQSELGEGARFNIYLPVVKSVEAEENKYIETVAPVRGTETILLAEDELFLRVVTKETFEEYGYKVIDAVDGEDAIDKFMRNRDDIHLILLDAIMPKKNGKEVYMEIRKIRPDIKTVFLSGYSADVIQDKGIHEDGLTLISKPISPVELLRKIREVLDR